MSLRIRFRPIRTRVVSKLLYKNLYHFVGHCGTFYDLKWTINALKCISAAEINITMQASNQNREAVGVCWRFLTASVKKKHSSDYCVAIFNAIRSDNNISTVYVFCHKYLLDPSQSSF